MVFIQVFCELHDKDCVLRRQPHCGEHAYLEKHIIGQASAEGRRHRTENTERNDQHDGDGYRPTLVEGGQAKEHDD
ncbi:hypothetical protein D3C85_1491170 [compost metagenome]